MHVSCILLRGMAAALATSLLMESSPCSLLVPIVKLLVKLLWHELLDR